MDKNENMIVVTGAAGFIGSCLVDVLNNSGRSDLILVDDFSSFEKTGNLANRQYIAKVHRDELFDWLKSNENPIEIIFHIGARTDTTLFDYEIFEKLNISYTKKIWKYCSDNRVPLIYASSAATYGNGEFGYDDDENIIPDLVPLNPYGASKHEVDKWILQQTNRPPNWYGLKFFNVYGPNEYHKHRMASVIWHAFNQIQNDGSVTLFKSHNPDFRDGEQLRDFIYVKDVIRVMLFLWENKPKSGIYNLGTGKARTFNDLANAIGKSLQKKITIKYIDTPLDIRDKYQYFTEANMEKLRAAGFKEEFKTLEAGVEDYVTNYLLKL